MSEPVIGHGRGIPGYDTSVKDTVSIHLKPAAKEDRDLAGDVLAMQRIARLHQEQFTFDALDALLGRVYRALSRP